MLSRDDLYDVLRHERAPTGANRTAFCDRMTGHVTAILKPISVDAQLARVVSVPIRLRP
jgi:hypothetical protein